jgi:hypothetical protein
MELIKIGEDFYDSETGEYAGPASVEAWPTIIDNEEAALFISRKILQAESELMAKLVEQEAVIKNLETMVRRNRSKVEYFRKAYNEQLSEYAFQQLPRKADGSFAAKTWTNPFLSVRFTTVKPSLKVEDEEKVLRFAEFNCPDAVKITKSVLVSKIDNTYKAALMSDENMASNHGFRIEPERQTATIKTGVGE